MAAASTAHFRNNLSVDIDKANEFVGNNIVCQGDVLNHI